jgi:hypothetical protein
MTVSTNSRVAYRNVAKKQQQGDKHQIVAHLAQATASAIGGLTGPEIAARMGKDHSDITSSLGELKSVGCIEVIGSDVNPVSNQHVSIYALRDAALVAAKRDPHEVALERFQRHARGMLDALEEMGIDVSAMTLDAVDPASRQLTQWRYRNDEFVRRGRGRAS